MLYQEDAMRIIRQLKDFDYEDFEKSFSANVVMAGNNNILQYLEERRRWNVKCSTNGNGLFNVGFSEQAKAFIEAIPEFDVKDFTIWFSNSLSVSAGNIIEYLNFKARSKIIIPKAKVPLK